MTVDRRRERLRIARDPALRGIDGARVAHHDAHTVVDIHFIPAAPGLTKAALPGTAELRAAPLRLEGEGARGWRVSGVDHSPDDRHAVRVTLTRAPNGPPPLSAAVGLRFAGLPHLAADFGAVTVRLARAARADVVTALAPPPHHAASTEIDYLAKDYASFVRLMLDRMSATLPEWTERHPADEGIAIVELLAYAADYLSYYQDAIATEAYLGTARSRTSVRRHARLLVYRMYEGCAPRVWLHFDVSSDGTLREGVVVTTADGESTVDAPQFRTLDDGRLYAANNACELYDYGAADFTLRSGATSAALVLPPDGGNDPVLHPGDVVILEQKASPATGREEDADPRLRQAVRLNATPRTSRDPLSGERYCELTWHERDALAFDLPVARRIASDDRTVRRLARALGNNVAADYGAHASSREPLPLVGTERYAPRLRLPDVTFAVPYDAAEAKTEPATAFTDLRAYKAVPQIRLEQRSPGGKVERRWTAVRDLLAADANARVFVLEIENDRTVSLRFGDGVHGRRPEAGSQFYATYRVGTEAKKHIGHDVLAAIPGVVFPGAAQAALIAHEPIPVIKAVRNPLPPAGGAAPQSIEQVRRAAPAAIRARRRAVIPADFADAAKALPGVRDAGADTIFTGSWETTRLFVQRAAAEGPETPRFLRYVREALESYRLAGTDLAVLPPSYVNVEAELEIAADPRVEREALRARVDAAIAHVLGSEAYAFGESVYASSFLAAAMRVSGVRDARMTRLARAGAPASGGVEPPPVPIGAHEVARVRECRVRFRGAGATA